MTSGRPLPTEERHHVGRGFGGATARGRRQRPGSLQGRKGRHPPGYLGCIASDKEGCRGYAGGMEWQGQA